MRKYILNLFDAASYVSRVDAEALQNPQLISDIIQSAIEGSTVLSMAKRLPDMSSNQTRMPILESLPVAYFVNSSTESGDDDIAQKKTTKMAWGKKFINAAELAVVVSIPINVIDDSSYDIVGIIKPRLVEAIHKKIDGAVLFGTDAPDLWPKSIYEQATTAGAVVESTANLYDDILGVGGTISMVEESGYFVNGHVADVGVRAALRSIKSTSGQPIFMPTMQDAGKYTLDGEPITFPRNGAMDKTKARIISGDWSQLVYAIRNDVKFEVFNTGVIQNPDGSIAYNLLQNDMIAIRAVIRLGWELPNPINQVEPGATRFPFAVLAPKKAEPAVG